MTPGSLRPEQQGGALGENRGDRRHRAPRRGQQAAGKCRQPRGMGWRALGCREHFNGDIFNSLCTGRAPFLMACMKATPALPCHLPKPSCLSLLPGCCRNCHLPARREGRGGNVVGSCPSLVASCTWRQGQGTRRGILLLLPCHKTARKKKKKSVLKRMNVKGREGKILCPRLTSHLMSSSHKSHITRSLNTLTAAPVT